MSTNEEKFKAEQQETARQHKLIRALFTPETTQRMVKKIHEIFGDEPCPMCRKGTRQVLASPDGPILFMVPMREAPVAGADPMATLAIDLMSAFTGAPAHRRELVTFVVLCDHCGMTSFHDATRLGMLDLTTPAGVEDMPKSNHLTLVKPCD